MREAMRFGVPQDNAPIPSDFVPGIGQHDWSAPDPSPDGPADRETWGAPRNRAPWSHEIAQKIRRHARQVRGTRPTPGSAYNRHHSHPD